MGPKLVGIVPCFRAEDTVKAVINALLAHVDAVIAIDDGSDDSTWTILNSVFGTNPRVALLQHEVNKGVGAAMVTAYTFGLQNSDGDIFIKVDSDGQMEPSNIMALIDPIISKGADYVKGNRFDSPRHLKGMPVARLLGNAALTFITKLASGYWSVSDPTNGFTAITRAHLARIELSRLSQRYFFESDLLFRLRLQRAVVKDVPLVAIYNGEVSHLKPLTQIPQFLIGNSRNFIKRIVYQYFVREWGPGSVVLPASWILGIFSITFGVQTWSLSASSGEPATAGTVALVMLPAILSVQLALSFLQIDIESEPR